MVNSRIKLLLDPHFIRFSADCYQWALDAKAEYKELSKRDQKDVDTYRRGVSYTQTAVDLINVEFKDVLSEQNLGTLSEEDAKRSWRVVSRREPKDPLGLAYTWFVTRISLYVPDRHGQVHRPLGLTTKKKSEIVDQLFHQFLDWAEENNYLGSLSPNPESPAFIDEIEGLFTTVIDVLTDSNPYVQQMFKDTALTEQAPSSVSIDEGSSELQTQTHTAQKKAN